MRRVPIAIPPLLAFALAVVAAAEPMPGEQITAAQADSLRGWIPDELFPFTVEGFDGLSMDIVETRDYHPADAYVKATAQYACQAKLDARGNLVDFVAGQPFPYSEWAKQATGHRCDLDPKDPQFALKLAWDVNYRWQGSGFNFPQWGFSYMRNGGKDLWRLGQGVYRRTYFSHRADLLPASDKLVPDTDVEWAEFDSVDDPFDLRGTMFLLYRYTNPQKEDDTWAYIPSLRRVRRIAANQKSDSLLGTELTFEDFYLFAGYVLNQDWSFGGESMKLAPMSTQRVCFPANMGKEFVDQVEGMIRLGSQKDWDKCKYGPYGALPFVNERWEKRKVFEIVDVPKQEGHPYSRKLIWYDKETMWPLYAIAYDRAGQPYKIFAHIAAWSEDTENPGNQGKRVVIGRALTVVNVQNLNSHVTQFFTSNVYPFSADETERYFDITRLKRRGR
jgi:Protein of unknown function (DUF1329)